ncbi:MAG TPA: metal ABC transporter ATP-binding protein [Acidimicrobiales bacterium]|nr:metal ABC transporter ATP-binding protein [Acidimicrobiales bacterium]
MTGPEPLLEVGDVAFSYGRHQVLDGVSMAVGPGEFVALAGSNGSGKSTLVRVALGLSEPQAGEVRLFGVRPAQLKDRWRVGYVPQRPVVVDQLPATVEEVVASGCVARRGWARRPRREDAGRVERALEVVALTELRRTPIVELSGGQQQRAFIARALASDPELLVLDEPIAGVDADSQSRFRDALVTRCHTDGVAVLLVSHELGAVEDDLDRIILLRGGAVVFDGPPADLTAEGVSLGVHHHDLPMWLEHPR